MFIAINNKMIKNLNKILNDKIKKPALPSAL